MDNIKLKRFFFFWIDKLEITRRERITLAVTCIAIVLVVGARIIVSGKSVKAPSNHEAIEELFKQRSAQIAKERAEELKKYDPPMISESSGTTSEIVETEMGADEPVMGETEQTKEREPQKESADQHIVHLNTATLTELMELPGIGQTYGLRIIEMLQKKC